MIMYFGKKNEDIVALSEPKNSSKETSTNKPTCFKNLKEKK